MKERPHVARRDDTRSLSVQSFLTLVWRHSWKREVGQVIRVDAVQGRKVRSEQL